MKHLLLIISVMMSITLTAQKAPQYEKRTFVSEKGDTLLYRLLAPEQTLKGLHYPLVLFLHGSGERGADNEKQLTHGGQMFLNPANIEKYPAYVIFPQCPEGKTWVGTDNSNMLATLKELVDSYSALPQIDEDEIHIIGLSMGGHGVFSMVSRYPNLFASATPICGWAKDELLPLNTKTAFRIFHGDNDQAVSVESSRSAYRTLTKNGNVKVYYTEYPGVGHGSWYQAFAEKDFMKWMYSQRKK
ncbi:MAG: dienelactone hydrolase family protein [Flavobacteriales bacterium]|nr:dienelactone hydrolase family protein [Flavobacteriales bacterium]